jgi:hypothetical protein
MLGSQTQFRRIIGHTHLAKLAVAVERDVAGQARRDPNHKSSHAAATAALAIAATPA